MDKYKETARDIPHGSLPDESVLNWVDECCAGVLKCYCNLHLRIIIIVIIHHWKRQRGMGYRAPINTKW